MTELPNRRHELFAQGLVEGKTADQAYSDAGYAPNRCNASRLKTNENIARRVEELQTEHRQRHDITVNDLLDEYDENRAEAFRTSQISAANGATTGKARLLGYDNGDAPNKKGTPKVAPLDDTDAVQRIAVLLNRSDPPVI